MSRRFERTVKNWRWWAIAPLFLLLLPIVVVAWAIVVVAWAIVVVAWAVEGMSDGVAKLTQALIAWRDGK